MFPEIFEGFLSASLIGKARQSGLIDVVLINPRDFSTDKFKRVDDTPYGGGPGMVLRVDVMTRAWEAARLLAPTAKTIWFTPQGRALTQSAICAWAGDQELILVCGHYEGVDERFIELCVDEQISLGDFVLTGGELPAAVLVDAMARWIPGVVGNRESVSDDSFSPLRLDDEELKHPQYTKPVEFMGLAVPDVLRSGHHEAIRKWRQEASRTRTRLRRQSQLPKDVS